MPPTDLPQGGPPPGSAAPIEPGGPRRSRWLMGCLAAAALLVLIAVVAIISFVTWIRTGGEPLDVRRLVDGDTVLYAELNLRPGDEAVERILMQAAERSSRSAAEAREEVPSPFQWAFGGGRRGPDAEDLRKTLPVTALVTRQEADPGLVTPALLTVSVPRMANRLRFVGWFGGLIVGWASEGEEELETRVHRDHKVIRIGDAGDGDRFWASLVSPNILVSRSEERITWAMDRLLDPAEEVGAGPPPELLAARPESALLFISARGGYADAVLRLIEKGSPEFARVLHPMLDGAGPVTIIADLKSPDILEGEIRVAAGSMDEEEQDEYAGSVTAVLPAGELAMALEPLPRAPGERHAWKMRVTGLEKVALGSLELFDIDERRPGSLPEVTVEPGDDEGSD